MVAFQRGANGRLEDPRGYRTEGRGSGGTVDPLSSQGSLTLSTDEAWLFAANAGSGSVRKIRANVISPGTIDTPILAPLPKQAIAQIVAGIPMGRMGSADEIANAAVFLASDESSFITGIELFVDGGTAQV